MAVPMFDPAGQEAGFALNVASGQACWIVVSREGRALGRVTATFPMFACPWLEVTVTSRLAPFFLLVFACVETLNVGLNGRLAPLVAWNGTLACALPPEPPVRVPVAARCSQLVGLNMNPGRSTVTFTCLICNGMPCKIVGNGSVSTVICAVRGSTCTLARTTTQSHGPLPISNGPAFAGTAIDRPNGAPL